MKKAASIFLRADMESQDVFHLRDWMSNGRVTRYLNEDAGAPEALERLARTTPAPMLRYHFNRQGRFFLVCDETARAIGFVKLREHAAGCYEIVFVIGEERLWGNGYGSMAVQAALAQAFFDWRASKLVAKIYHENVRSVQTVRRCGFREERRLETLSLYSITMQEYLRQMTRGKLA